MGFESQGTDNFYTMSPGGFEFGVQGWTWGLPVPKSITFFLDGSVMVCDQYGRQIRRVLKEDGTELLFADMPPDDDRQNGVKPRPQFATHMQTLEALAAEKIDWLSYEVRYRPKQGGRPMVRQGLTLKAAQELQLRLLKEGNDPVSVARTIVYAGWPQLPYDWLKTLPEVPPTPMEDLRKILDPQLRKDAMRLRKETDEIRAKELQLQLTE